MTDAYDSWREDHEADLRFEADRDAWLHRIHEVCSERGHYIPLGEVRCDCGARDSRPVPESPVLVRVPDMEIPF